VVVGLVLVVVVVADVVVVVDDEVDALMAEVVRIVSAAACCAFAAVAVIAAVATVAAAAGVVGGSSAARKRKLTPNSCANAPDADISLCGVVVSAGSSARHHTFRSSTARTRVVGLMEVRVPTPPPPAPVHSRAPAARRPLSPTRSWVFGVNAPLLPGAD
jgi:hypothetical protein